MARDRVYPVTEAIGELQARFFAGISVPWRDNSKKRDNGGMNPALLLIMLFL